VEDLEAELARVKKDASEHAAQLAADSRTAQEGASAARSEAARSRVGTLPAPSQLRHSKLGSSKCSSCNVPLHEISRRIGLFGRLTHLRLLAL